MIKLVLCIHAICSIILTSSACHHSLIVWWNKLNKSETFYLYWTELSTYHLFHILSVIKAVSEKCIRVLSVMSKRETYQDLEQEWIENWIFENFSSIFQYIRIFVFLWFLFVFLKHYSVVKIVSIAFKFRSEENGFYIRDVKIYLFQIIQLNLCCYSLQ